MRVRLRLCSSRCVETSALVNSGFESDEPEIILPPPVADAIGLRPSTTLASYVAAGGGSVTAVRGDGPVSVQLLLEEGEGPRADAVASIVPGEEEVLLSDRLTHDLGIAIVDPYEGLWCLRGELGSRLRRSAPPQRWRA